ncbi:MAG: AIR synthase family protein [Clostridiales Family XIII bacterium]|jgi:hydrogenase expression/formation protein HypE|nr:AIR synthase family protein [Clostridiales Family XIII bacterium]
MLKTGKLPNELLQDIVLRHIRPRRQEVIVRPGVGEDCAVIDFGDAECVLSMDPITASATGAGALAVHVSCNDIASNGVAPLGIMLTLLLPEGTAAAEVENIMREAAEAAAALDVEIIGGHTEITPAVNTAVIVSTAVGKSVKKNGPRSRKPMPGDVILLTKRVGLEGTGIIAGDREAELSEILTASELAEAKGMLAEASVVKEGVIAGAIGFAAMHDVTEGGVLGALWEVCNLAGLGAVVHEDNIPVAEITKRICDYFQLDVLRLISSGAMLIVAETGNAEDILAALSQAGVEASRIGELRGRNEGVVLVKRDGARMPVEAPGSDELYKLISSQGARRGCLPEMGKC